MDIEKEERLTQIEEELNKANSKKNEYLFNLKNETILNRKAKKERIKNTILLSIGVGLNFGLVVLFMASIGLIPVMNILAAAAVGVGAVTSVILAKTTFKDFMEGTARNAAAKKIAKKDDIYHFINKKETDHLFNLQNDVNHLNDIKEDILNNKFEKKENALNKSSLFTDKTPSFIRTNKKNTDISKEENISKEDIKENKKTKSR